MDARQRRRAFQASVGGPLSAAAVAAAVQVACRCGAVAVAPARRGTAPGDDVLSLRPPLIKAVMEGLNGPGRPASWNVGLEPKAIFGWDGEGRAARGRAARGRCPL